MLTLSQKLSNSKGDNLNLIRLFLAMLVIFSHSFNLMLTTGDNEPLHHWTHDVSFGTVAVYAFFFISGFLITGSWGRSKSFLEFFIKRVLRIYPAYIVALLGCAVLIWNFGTQFKQSVLSAHGTGQWIKMLAHDGFLLKCNSINDINAFGHNPRPGLTNAPLWTIPLEFTCYMAVLAAGVCFILRNRWLVLILTGMGYQFCVMMMQQYNHQQDQFFLCFACGAVAWMWKDKIPFSWPLAALSLVALVATSHFRPWFSVAFPAAGGYCLLWLAYAPKLPLAKWTSKTDMSYGTYLYGFPIQQILISYMATYTILQSPIVNFLLAVPLTLVLAFTSWTLVEKPCLSLKRFVRKTGPARQRATPDQQPTAIIAAGS